MCKLDVRDSQSCPAKHQCASGATFSAAPFCNVSENDARFYFRCSSKRKQRLVVGTFEFWTVWSSELTS